MALVLCCLLVAVVEWSIFPFLPSDQQWYFALTAKYADVAFISTALVSVFTGTLLWRSVVVLFCGICWADLLNSLLWAISGQHFNSALFVFLWLCCWLVFVLRRNYQIAGDDLDEDSVFLLFLRPRSPWEIAKALFGIPLSSVCLYSQGYAWSFRHKSGVYEINEVPSSWLNKHIAKSTGHKMTPEILAILCRKIGTKRGIGIKCVYQIRDVLKLLGAPPKTILHCIPGVYAMQILGGKMWTKK